MFNKDKPMTLNEAQKHAHRLVRERKAMEFMADVIDAAVWAEDGMKNAELAVETAQEQVHVLEGHKVQLEAENLALEEAQENTKRRGRELSETLVTYEAIVNGRLEALDTEYAKHAEELGAQTALLEASKETLLKEVAALRADKANIEGVIEAFQRANAGSDA